jgi:hypothetical protein
VTTPISNDNSLALTAERGLRTRGRDGESPSRVNATDPADTPSSASGADPRAGEVTLDRATHLYKAQSRVGEQQAGGTVQTPEEARSLLGRIRDQIAASPVTALAAFSQITGSQASALLEQAPA